MSDLVVLDAVSVATVARVARDLRHGRLAADESPYEVLPECIADALRCRDGAPLRDGHHAGLDDYARELDEIAESAVALDQHEHEIEHQLRWWGDRAAVLEARLTGHPADDVEVVRELALYRGRISGAHTMRRHYAQQRAALADRHARADVVCADLLADA